MSMKTPGRKWCACHVLGTLRKLEVEGDEVERSQGAGLCSPCTDLGF